MASPRFDKLSANGGWSDPDMVSLSNDGDTPLVLSLSKHVLGRREFVIGGAAAALLAACRGKPSDASRAQEPNSMKGKTCLVTGATSGIGAVAALELARMGATVIVSGRSARKCDEHAEQIRRATGARVETAVADLASMDQVRKMAMDVARRFERIDVLANNAGTVLYERQVTPDGFEKTFAVNHLAPFLLTNLLLDRVKASPAGRVVNVSSTAHLKATLDFDNLQGERRYERLDAYGRSKLALLMFTYELARRLEGSTVTANAIHPGVVATELGAEGGVKEWLRVRVRNLTSRTMLSPEQGGGYLVQAASSPDLAGVSGRYISMGKQTESSPASRDVAAQKRLWDVSEQLVSRWLKVS